jgi:hypothetical protein
MTKDIRRFGDISTVRENDTVYRLIINRVLWASVEWSSGRGAWCIEDGIGRCLAHVDHIHGEEKDAQVAIRLARKMIRDGRMPTPEEAHKTLRHRQRAPAVTVEPEPVPIPIKGTP